ncbi:hypothetical protein [Actinoplanes nipponensis]|uniref:hypothetical protein n=1 Tax=Actinoplanes nipponensis TaxID=135950 RepID=UPI0031EA8E11
MAGSAVGVPGLPQGDAAAAERRPVRVSEGQVVGDFDVVDVCGADADEGAVGNGVLPWMRTWCGYVDSPPPKGSDTAMQLVLIIGSLVSPLRAAFFCLSVSRSVAPCTVRPATVM